jgi:hypothetical protein
MVVPFGGIFVLFRRGFPAFMAGWVSFSFIHTNVMPGFKNAAVFWGRMVSQRAEMF